MKYQGIRIKQESEFKTWEIVCLVILGIAIIALFIFYQVKVNEALNRYQDRCEKVGWEVCEQEYYETHTPNGMLK